MGKDSVKPRHTKPEWATDTENMGFFSFWWYQYLLCSALYMLEPWERNLFHTLIALVFGMMFYSAYIYLPYHSVYIYHTVQDLTFKLWEMFNTTSTTATT